MKIDELIEELEAVKQEHGNLEIVVDMCKFADYEAPRIIDAEHFKDGEKKVDLKG